MAGRWSNRHSSEGFPGVLVIGKFTSPTAHFQSEYAGFFFDIWNGYAEFVALLKSELEWVGGPASGSRPRSCVDEEEIGFEDCEVLSENRSSDQSSEAVQEMVAKEVTRTAARSADASSMGVGDVDHIDYVVFCGATNVRVPS